MKNLLLQAPLKEKSILALISGYRTGCKVAVIDKNGFYREMTVLFLVGEMHSPKQLAEAEKKIIDYVNKYKIDIIIKALPQGETESFVVDVIKKNKLDVVYGHNQAGASIYYIETAVQDLTT